MTPRSLSISSGSKDTACAQSSRISSDRSITRRVVGGNLQLVDGLVEARVGVDVRAEAHAGRLQEGDDVLLREVPRAVEAHVLDEVREPALVVVFENRSGIDDEPELGATLAAACWRGGNTASHWAACRP